MCVFAVGVGHVSGWRTWAESFGSPRLLNFPFLRFTASSATGVCQIGEYPEPVAAVRGADGTRRDTVPFDIVPERGQVPEYGSEVVVSKESTDVLQERVAGSNLAKDAGRPRPAVPFVVGPALATGAGKGLTGEAASDDIHAATPGSSVEGAGVIPDREQGEQTVPLATEEHFPVIREDFHTADGAPAEEGGAEESATSAGKK